MPCSEPGRALPLIPGPFRGQTVELGVELGDGLLQLVDVAGQAAVTVIVVPEAVESFADAVADLVLHGLVAQEPPPSD